MSTTASPTTGYFDLLYHLDLCILAYHLYHQTLIWPADPYYEQMATKRPGVNRRDDFMAQVVPTLEREPKDAQGQWAFRGPGSFEGLATNARLDPIVTDYGRANPWAPSAIRPEPQRWDYMIPAPYITGRIGRAFMIQQEGAPVPLPAAPAPAGDAPPAGDSLYGFEGGTGSYRASKERDADNRLKIRPPAWSLLGFALARDRGEGEGRYDVHIVFRGSRSGSAARAAKQGLLENRGNPDWVTDMNFAVPLVEDDDLFATIPGAKNGGIALGFGLSIQNTMPNLVRCLAAIHAERGRPPERLHITGHSLGGALAASCAAALVLGTQYGPYGTKLPAPLGQWPWDRLDLVTFSAPTICNEGYRTLYNGSRIAGRRVNLPRDPVTSDVFGSNGWHVGARVPLRSLGLPHNPFTAHEPMKLRGRLLEMAGQLGEPVPEGAVTCWETYTSFGAVRARQSLDTPAKLQAVLAGFKDNLQLYLKVYKSRKDPARGVFVQNLIDVLAETDPIVYAAHLATPVSQSALNNMTKDAELKSFFALNLGLAGLSLGCLPEQLPKWLLTMNPSL